MLFSHLCTWWWTEGVAGKTEHWRAAVRSGVWSSRGGSHELRRRQPNRAVLDLRPAESAALQPLGVKAQARAVSENQLHPIGALVPEYELGEIRKSQSLFLDHGCAAGAIRTSLFGCVSSLNAGISRCRRVPTASACRTLTLLALGRIATPDGPLDRCLFTGASSARTPVRLSWWLAARSEGRKA